MTKARTPDTLPHAAMVAIATLGAAAVARIVQRSEHHVYRWGNPEPDGDRPNVEQAFALDRAMIEAGHEPPFAAALQAMLRAVAAPPQAPVDPRARLLGLMREVGELAGAVTRAAADGRINAAERAAIQREATEARAQLDALLRDVAVPGAAGAGPRLVGGGEGA